MPAGLSGPAGVRSHCTAGQFSQLHRIIDAPVCSRPCSDTRYSTASGDFSRLKQAGAGATLGEHLLDIVEAGAFKVRSDHLAGRRVVDHRGVHAGRQHRVDRDAIFGHLARQRFHQCRSRRSRRRRTGPGTATACAGKTRRHRRSHHATRASQSLAGNTPKSCRRTLFSLANEFNALTGKSFL